ncbi:MAG: hypothetical protein ACYC3X_31280, partial [Pirellulaceae bacterium]
VGGAKLATQIVAAAIALTRAPAHQGEKTAPIQLPAGAHCGVASHRAQAAIWCAGARGHIRRRSWLCAGELGTPYATPPRMSNDLAQRKGL